MLNGAAEAVWLLRGSSRLGHLMGLPRRGDDDSTASCAAEVDALLAAWAAVYWG
jgi:hypothetical protein